MPSLQERLLAVLSEVLPLQEESDGALTVRHDGTIASLRVVTITEDLDLVSLTQILAWDLLLTKKIRDSVAEQAHSTLLGSVALVEKAGESTTKRNSTKTADVMLRYNFPGGGLSDDALRTLILMVLDKGAEIRQRADRLTPAATVRAGAEDLDGVADIGEAVSGRHFGCPRLDLVVAHLDRRPAAAAHQVVVMVFRAAPVDRFAGVGAQRVEHARGGHRLQRPVDGGQADVLAAPPQLVVQFLGRAEVVERVQQRRDRRPLPGRPHAGASASRLVLAGVRDGVDRRCAPSGDRPAGRALRGPTARR